jgi:copper oxidase (laccase) domain-containing protein
VARVSAAGFAGEGDALITSEHDLCLSVAVADCVPVALVGGEDVGMVHSGWRGTLAGVAEKAARLMESKGVRAYVGPSIRRCCYEVSEELAQGVCGQVRGWSGLGAQPLVPARNQDRPRTGRGRGRDLGSVRGAGPTCSTRTGSRGR